MTIALSQSVDPFSGSLAERGAQADAAGRALGGLLARIARGLSFAREARLRHDQIIRLAALPDEALLARGFERASLVHQVYWLEFAE